MDHTGLRLFPLQLLCLYTLNIKFMIKLLSFFLLTFLSMTSTAQSTMNIVPFPQTIEMKAGIFMLDKNFSIQYAQEDPELKRLDIFLRGQLKNRFGIKVSNKKKHTHALIFTIDEKLTRLGNEGYTLHFYRRSTAFRLAGNDARCRAAFLYGGRGKEFPGYYVYL